MSVLTAATPTSAWIGGTAAATSPYTVTWKDASTSLSSGYTNWDPSASITSDNLYTVMGNGTWTADKDHTDAANKHSLMCQAKPS